MADGTGYNKSNVSLGKTKASGVVWWAPAGTKLPTDAVTKLADTYRTPGYVSEDGITVSTSIDTQEIKEMGGSVVLNEVSSYSETVQFTLIETSADSLKLRYGEGNVKTVSPKTNTTVYTVTHTMPSGGSIVLVLEIAMTGNRVKRIVIPEATLSDVGDITYSSGDAIGYDMTFTANPSDAIDGATSVEYIANTVSD